MPTYKNVCTLQIAYRCGSTVYSVKRKSQTYLKSVFKIFSTCSSASSKTWTTLHDSFIDDQLIILLKRSHSSIRRNFSWATSNSAAVLQLAPDRVIYRGLLAKSSQRAGAMKSGVSRVTVARFSRVLWARSVVLLASHFRTSDGTLTWWKLTYFVVDIWWLIALLLMNIF